MRDRASLPVQVFSSWKDAPEYGKTEDGTGTKTTTFGKTETNKDETTYGKTENVQETKTYGEQVATTNEGEHELHAHGNIGVTTTQKLIREQGYSTSRVKIGNNCWICTNTVILKGVEIGDNSVIGAGCIIYRDIPANSVVKNNGGITVESLEW